MNKYKAELTDEFKTYWAERFAEAIFDEGGKIAVDVKAGSGMGYSVNVKIYYYDENRQRVDSVNATYWLAAVMGKTVFDDGKQWLRFSGIGYDRYHDTAYTLATYLERYAPQLFTDNLASALDLATASLFERA